MNLAVVLLRDDKACIRTIQNTLSILWVEIEEPHCRTVWSKLHNESHVSFTAIGSPVSGDRSLHNVESETVLAPAIERM